MKTTDNIVYTVRGKWPFPMDMLRRDMAIASFPEDRNLIEALSEEHPRVDAIGKSLHICLTVKNDDRWKNRVERDRFMPHIERWKSFGWEVVSIDNSPIEPAVTPPAAKRSPMVEIPIAAAEDIARRYGYDQVVIYARRCDDSPLPHGEHMTTYGRTPAHCKVAAQMGKVLQQFMKWKTS